MLPVLLLAGCNLVKPLMGERHSDPSRDAGSSARWSNARGTPDPSKDVLHYALQIRFYPESRSLAGSVTFTVRLTGIANPHLPPAPDSAFYLAFDLQQPLQLDSVVVPGQKVTYAYQTYAGYFLALTKPLPIDSLLRFTVYYHGTPRTAPNPPWQGGAVWANDDGTPWAGVACQTEGASIWWPCEDHPSDPPDSLDMFYTVADGLSALGNGRLVAESSSAEGLKTFHWQVSVPISPYNVTYYLGRFQHWQIPYSSPGGELRQIGAYFRLPDQPGAQGQLAQLQGMLSYFERTFGPYPFWDDGLYVVGSPYRGMEHQGAIAYGTRFRNHPATLMDHLLLHELAHQWWGNAVAAADPADWWLHEGLATYSEYLYTAHVRGNDVANSFLDQLHRSVRNQKPLLGQRGTYATDVLANPDIYAKGALLLHTFRGALNNDAWFFQILRTYYGRFRYGRVQTEDFLACIAEVAGQSWDWFFDPYLRQATPPTLAYVLVPSDQGREAAIYYRWIEVPDSFRLRIYLHNPLLRQRIALDATPHWQRESLSEDLNWNFDQRSAYFELLPQGEAPPDSLVARTGASG